MKTVIFDLDGTLLNTIGDLTAAVCHALEKAKLPLRSQDEVQKFVGNGLHRLSERAVPPGTPKALTEEVYLETVSYYRIHNRDRTTPYPGIPELLRRLRADGYRTAVVSNKADFAVRDLVHFYFPELFDLAVGETNSVRIKPSPDMPLLIMQKLPSTPEECVLIGDSDVDFETARNTGIRSILVDWGFRSRDYLLACGADRIVSDTDGLYREIKALL